jgi:iron complex transport system substrate-binding protein
MSQDFSPQRVVSLQPSATVILERLGLIDRVVACTKYCRDVCPDLAEDLAIVSDSWTAQAEQIKAARPDLVIASVPYQLEAVAEILKSGVPFLGLAPHSLHDIYADIARIAGIMGVPENGAQVIRHMQVELENVRQRSRTARRPLVFCEEWGKPIIHSQPWVMELVETAGGEFAGEPGRHTSAEAVRQLDPEVMIFAWCGAGDRVPLEKIIRERSWSDTRAARTGRVYCVRDEYLNTPAPTVLFGLRAIAWTIHGGEKPHGIRQIGAAVDRENAECRSKNAE